MYHYSNIEEDIFLNTNSDSQDFWADIDGPQILSAQHQPSKPKKPLREKNNSGKIGGYKHVPHREKPLQVVAKRNARERRRVQAVNNAFVKLKNIVPIQNNRGKRISKVKTLLYAIDYIRILGDILQECDSSIYKMTDYGLQTNMDDAPGNWILEKDCFLSNKDFS